MVCGCAKFDSDNRLHGERFYTSYSIYALYKTECTIYLLKSTQHCTCTRYYCHCFWWNHVLQVTETSASDITYWIVVSTVEKRHSAGFKYQEATAYCYKVIRYKDTYIHQAASTVPIYTWSPRIISLYNRVKVIVFWNQTLRLE